MSIDNEYTDFEYIKTPYVDTLLETHQRESVMRLRGIDATEEEKEELSDAESALNEELEYIAEIQKDLIEHLKQQGCNCIETYLFKQ